MVSGWILYMPITGSDTPVVLYWNLYLTRYCGIIMHICSQLFEPLVESDDTSLFRTAVLDSTLSAGNVCLYQIAQSRSEYFIISWECYLNIHNLQFLSHGIGIVILVMWWQAFRSSRNYPTSCNIQPLNLHLMRCYYTSTFLHTPLCVDFAEPFGNLFRFYRKSVRFWHVVRFRAPKLCLFLLNAHARV